MYSALYNEFSLFFAEFREIVRLEVILIPDRIDKSSNFKHTSHYYAEKEYMIRQPFWWPSVFFSIDNLSRYIFTSGATYIY